MLRRRHLPLALCLALLTGCPGLDDTPAAGSWTVMVYLLADNDLEPAALGDLEEMMAVGSTDSLTILAQVDRAQGESEDAVGGLGNWHGSSMPSNRRTAPPRANMAAPDSASPSTGTWPA